MLELQNLFKSFGGLLAINNVSFEIKEGEIVGLIGPNGAGKTTIFNLITGVLHPDSGKILFNGEDITNLPPYKICQRGIARTFQLVRTFNMLTPLQNVIAGKYFGSKPTGDVNRARVEAQEILDFVGLSCKEVKFAGMLGLIDRKRLEIARALATGPKLLLLDEMFAGLNTTEMDEAIRLVKAIRDKGISLIVVEHVMKVIMGISDRVIVLDLGSKIADCKPQEVAKNARVIEAYLGKKSICYE